MEEKINACQTLADIAELERTHLLNEEERRLVFERRLQIFLRIHEWREENKRLGLEPTISDFWTPEQRETYLRDWLDDSDVMEAVRGEKRTHDEMMNEEPSTSHQVNEEVLQMGRGEVDDNERPFYIESVTQVNTKKFKTKAMNYRVQFTNALADVEITSLHEQLHEIFQKGDKGGMANAKMYTFLEQNIVGKAFLWLHKLTHKLTFGIIYFLKI